jgi:signal recognition particle receptor subunit beta
MTLINMKKKEIQAKIVYYGPGRGGKTTNLRSIFEKIGKKYNTNMVEIKTEGDRTLFFDFLPFNVGKLNGFDVRMQLYTVPGQVKYDATRRLVLNGAEGVVFVADSIDIRRKQNIESIKNLHQNLKTYNRTILDVPLVLQYNKRDLAEQGTPLASVETLEKDLNSQLKVPSFEASAVTGHNVIPTLEKIIALTMNCIKQEMKGASGRKSQNE